MQEVNTREGCWKDLTYQIKLCPTMTSWTLWQMLVLFQLSNSKMHHVHLFILMSQQLASLIFMKLDQVLCETKILLRGMKLMFKVGDGSVWVRRRVNRRGGSCKGRRIQGRSEGRRRPHGIGTLTTNHTLQIAYIWNTCDQRIIREWGRRALQGQASSKRAF